MVNTTIQIELWLETFMNELKKKSENWLTASSPSCTAISTDESSLIISGGTMENSFVE